MSNESAANNTETSETTNNEITIELNDQETNDTSNKNNNVESPSFVERKQIFELTPDERAIIVANAKNGIDQPNYTVKFNKNGTYRILKKKIAQPTVAQRALSQSATHDDISRNAMSERQLSTPSANNKIYYTDNQLLFEHIIELNNKVDKLMAKHKKLKHRYQTLQNDIYVDSEELSNNESPTEDTIMQSAMSDRLMQSTTSTAIQEEHTEQQTSQNILPDNNSTAFMNTQIRNNWRSRIRYL